MHVLRAEKGFVIVGQETDGTVIPDDLGLSRTIARSKPDFVGKRSLARPDMIRDDRKQLVGLLSDVVLEEGAQLTDDGTVSLGHVTSAYHSAVLGRPIALASAVERPVPDRNEIAGAAFARRCRRDRHRADILRSGRGTNEPGHWVGGANRRHVGRRRPVDNACRGGDADRHDVGRGNANASGQVR